MILTDRYGLTLSTTDLAARDAYVEGCAAKLTMYPGAIEAFDRAVEADPGFGLAHAAKAHALLERGNAAAARESIAAAQSLSAGVSDREASHIAYFGLAHRRRQRWCPDRRRRASYRLATRRNGARHNRLHQRPDRQFRPSRSEAHAARPAGHARAGLRGRLVVHRAPRHGAIGEWAAQCSATENRTIAGAEPEQSVGGACLRASCL